MQCAPPRTAIAHTVCLTAWIRQQHGETKGSSKRPLVSTIVRCGMWLSSAAERYAAAKKETLKHTKGNLQECCRGKKGQLSQSLVSRSA